MPCLEGNFRGENYPPLIRMFFLDLRLFDAWKKVKPYSPKWCLDGDESQGKKWKITFWLVVEPTHLKNMLVKMGIFPSFRGENKKCLKPSPSLKQIQVFGGVLAGKANDMRELLPRFVYPPRTTNTSPDKRNHFKRQNHLPTIGFQGGAVSFRESTEMCLVLTSKIVNGFT